jgi:hypothetical protein
LATHCSIEHVAQRDAVNDAAMRAKPPARNQAALQWLDLDAT